MGDIIAEKIFGMSAFTWGATDLANQSALRSEYLKAVKAADIGNLEPLLNFARS
jgi:hypothetical protein